MNRTARNLIFALLALLALVPATDVMGARRDKEQAQREADRLKARYLFLEAQTAKSNNMGGAYYDLLCRAHQLDPENSAVAYHLGLCLVTMRYSTKEQRERGLALMKQHFDKAPDDSYEANFYSRVCMAMGHTDEALRALQRVNDNNPGKPAVLDALAEGYAQTGQFERAFNIYDSISMIVGQQTDVVSKKAELCIAMGDTVRAIDQLRQLLATAPDNAEYNMVMGGGFMMVGMGDSALAYFDRAQRLAPDDGTPYLAKAQYYYSLGDSANYDQQIEQALTAPNLEVEQKMHVLIDYSKRLLAGGDSTHRSERLFDVLVDQHPRELQVRELYSDYLIARRNYHAAAEQLTYALDLNPTDADGWHRLMIVNMMDENYPAAIAAAERAIEYNPDSLDVYTYVGPAYYQMAEYDKAIAIYDRALELTDSNDVEHKAELLGGKADALFMKKDTLQAFDCYEQALQLDPSDTGVMNNYAYFLALANHDLDRAERLSALSLKFDPNNATFLDTYAWICFKRKDYAKALDYIRQAIEKLDYESVEVLHHYGDILFMNGEHDQAVEQWQHALELDPDNTLLQRKVKHKTYIEQ